MDYLKEISVFKWRNGYTCLKCQHSEYYTVKSYARRCKECGYEESVTKNTAFEGQRIPVADVMDMLMFMQEGFLEWKGTKYLNLLLKDKTGNNIRPSTESLAERYKLQQKAVWALFQKLGEWRPDVHPAKFDLNSAPDEWLLDLKTDKSIEVYQSIFALMFKTEGDDGWTPRSEAEMLYILVTKEIMEREYLNTSTKNKNT